MIELSEGELLFRFPGAIDGEKFDGPGHGLSHCMKAVDLVVEWPDRLLFVEVKDPDQSGALPANRQAFVGKLRGDVLTRNLAGKFRDSLLYRWALGRPDKPVTYAVLVQMSALGPVELITLGDKLKRQLPLQGPGWVRRIASGVVVLDMARWNRVKRLGTVSRV